MKHPGVASVPAADLAAEPWVDWGKAIASQLIVWHHLVHYGPLAPRVSAWLPDAVEWLDTRALYAVQVFLVMGGYLAGRSLWPQPGQPRIGPADWAGRVARRWRRLMPLYLAALALAVLAAALARHLMEDEDTPDAPGIGQLLAHLLLAQDLLEQPALSAGLWYVAIDLQLYALLAAMAALVAWAGGATTARWRGGLGAGLLLAAALASITGFNLQDGADVLAPYFFGSYALGVLAAWGRGAPSGAAGTRWGLAIVLLAGIGLLLVWRDRLALAALCAGLLWWQPGRGAARPARRHAVVALLARISYAVFLVHYPVSLAVNALAVHLLPDGAGPAAVALAGTWLLSLATAWLLTRGLEPGAVARPAWLARAASGRSGSEVR